MIKKDTLIDRIMAKFSGTPAEVQERRRQLYAIANESLAKLAAEFEKVFPKENAYELDSPRRQKTVVAA